MTLDFLSRFAPLGFWWLGAPVLLLDLVAIGRAARARHGVESTLAWIFAVLAFPGVERARTYCSPTRTRQTQRPQKARGANPALEVRRQGRRRVERRGATAQSRVEPVRPSATSGNRVDVLVRDAHSFEKSRRRSLPRKKSIWAEYYIVNDDETGHRFLDLLAKAARRGVDVRLFVRRRRVDRDRLEAAERNSHSRRSGRVRFFPQTRCENVGRCTYGITGN